MPTIAAQTLITAAGTLDLPLIHVEDGRIVGIASRHAAEAPPITHHFPEAILTAGLFDIHMHGAAGHDVMEAEPAALDRIASHLARAGVTEYLATTVTASLDTTFRALAGIARHIEQAPSPTAAAIAGIHIEGPFVSHAKRGMHPAEFIVPPTPDLLDRLWQAARGHIRLMTIAPELPGALATIARATQLGIRTSLGHSNATKPEAEAGIAAGATSATHTFNAMRPLDHREPGILGVVLDRDDLFADLICDGIHVAPEIVRLWLKAKGPDKAILITDSLEATGMPNGAYKLGETPIVVRDGTCLTQAGVLAGSILTLDQAVANLRRVTGAPLATALCLASYNPARMIGLPEPLQPGAPANFLLLTSQGPAPTPSSAANSSSKPAGNMPGALSLAASPLRVGCHPHTGKAIAQESRAYQPQCARPEDKTSPCKKYWT